MDRGEMAEITANLRTFLLADSGISTAFGTRIYVVYAPDTQTYPFAIIRLVTDQAAYMQTAEALREAVVQIDIYDDDLAGCITNANLLRAKLTGYRGAIGDMTVGAVFVRENRREWSPEARHFRALQQYDIKWTVP
jgi:hypothetical protein